MDSEDGTAKFLTRHYPENYFTHIIIDECHRSAWGRWSQVLTRNPDAVQIGLTATPRQTTVSGTNKEAETNNRITADNVQHFGEPAYEYDIACGIEDGYLAACEIVQRNVILDRFAEEKGITRQQLADKKLTDTITGQLLSPEQARDSYSSADFEALLVMPERVAKMCCDLFNHLLISGGPEQKTIIFCARDAHAEAVTAKLNNLYTAWCKTEDKPRLDSYAFKCTAASDGSSLLPDFRGGERHHFVATTVDLLTTGVDVPRVRNVVFFKYIRSPISFYQMVGRGTRIDVPTGKLMFRVYDYTNASRLFGGAFRTKWSLPRKPIPPEEGPEGPELQPETVVQVEGFEVQITEAGRSILTEVDGKAMPVTVEEYREQLAATLVSEAPTLTDFRAIWVEPDRRRQLIGVLPEGSRSVEVIRTLDDMKAFDPYDVLAGLSYGAAPRTRTERADAFRYKHRTWLDAMLPQASKVVLALASQFAKGGTDSLENPQVFCTPEVTEAGGLSALQAMGKPAEVLKEIKERMFAA